MCVSVCVRACVRVVCVCVCVFVWVWVCVSTMQTGEVSLISNHNREAVQKHEHIGVFSSSSQEASWTRISTTLLTIFRKGENTIIAVSKTALVFCPLIRGA